MILKLPNELLMKIFNELLAVDLRNLRLVSRLFRDLAAIPLFKTINIGQDRCLEDVQNAARLLTSDAIARHVRQLRISVQSILPCDKRQAWCVNGKITLPSEELSQWLIASWARSWAKGIYTLLKGFQKALVSLKIVGFDMEGRDYRVTHARRIERAACLKFVQIMNTTHLPMLKKLRLDFSDFWVMMPLVEFYKSQDAGSNLILKRNVKNLLRFSIRNHFPLQDHKESSDIEILEFAVSLDRLASLTFGLGRDLKRPVPTYVESIGKMRSLTKLSIEFIIILDSLSNILAKLSRLQHIRLYSIDLLSTTDSWGDVFNTLTSSNSIRLIKLDRLRCDEVVTCGQEGFCTRTFEDHEAFLRLREKISNFQTETVTMGENWNQVCLGCEAKKQEEW